MPPPLRVKAALQAMNNIGFSSKDVAPVLKKLLEVYDNNWGYIEENGYQVLIDCILEQQDSKASGVNKQDGVAGDGPEHCLKRLRKISDDPSPTMLGSDGHCEPAPKRLAVEAYVSPQMLRREMTPPLSPWGDNHKETGASSRSRRISVTQESAEHSLLLTYGREELHIAEGAKTLCVKEPKIEPDTEVQKATKALADDDMQKLFTPIAMIFPPNHPIPGSSEAHLSECSQGDSFPGNISSLQAKAAEQPHHNAAKWTGKRSITLQNDKESELVASPDASSTVDIISSDTGEVKLMLGFNSRRPDIRMVGLDAFLRKFEQRCLHSHKILQPGSMMKIMKEMCEFASVWTTEASDERQENIVKLTSAVGSMEKADGETTLDGNGSLNDDCTTTEVHGLKGNGESEKEKEIRVPDDPKSLAVVQLPEVALWELRPPHDPNDISKGEERFRISFVNEVSNERYPSSFHYIHQNLVHQNAYVNFSLARIGDENCCSDCFGDCLAAAIPCACARETGGEFAYTSDGLVKEAFLDECISMNRQPQKHHHIYCQDCPLERSKRRGGKCKGHLVQTFIKECWSKCGCHKQCKNRIVQRGITCNLQVFFTPEGKGWGLRTLDELLRGAFVCEYVGEVLTNMELYNRTIQITGNAKHTYPVLLDADWGSEGVLKDEEALCLDATFYGNAARFVNHRCVDANLVEIPVEVETPDHHYYHLAFFTTRIIEPYEELTWDYGIDFDDVGHPVKAFKCRCGSKFCRDVKRSKSRSKALILK